MFSGATSTCQSIQCLPPLGDLVLEERHQVSARKSLHWFPPVEWCGDVQLVAV
jgi:hypothetical protein